MTSASRFLATAVAFALAAPAIAAQEPRVTEVQGISLLGDTLRRPRFDSATSARMIEQLGLARVEAAARPNDPDALIWVGRRLAYMGRYLEAIDVFSDGV